MSKAEAFLVKELPVKWCKGTVHDVRQDEIVVIKDLDDKLLEIRNPKKTAEGSFFQWEASFTVKKENFKQFLSDCAVGGLDPSTEV